MAIFIEGIKFTPSYLQFAVSNMSEKSIHLKNMYYSDILFLYSIFFSVKDIILHYLLDALDEQVLCSFCFRQVKV